MIEWPNGLQRCAVARMVMGSTRTNACGCMICKYADQKDSAPILDSKQSASVTPEVSARMTQATLALKLRADVTRSLTQVQGSGLSQH